MNSVCSWSGGKDSCFALMQAMKEGYVPKVLLNVLNEEGRISRSHGIPSALLQEQSLAAGIPIHFIESSWKEYEPKFIQVLKQLTDRYTLTHAVFGDIDLQAHKDWEEKVCKEAGLQAILPLWKQDRLQLVIKMLESGIETIIVSCNEVMGEKFLGKTLTPILITELQQLAIDPCGENGEFHTLVVNCPLFKKKLHVQVMEKLLYERYWFCKLQMWP
ncbi:MAG: diphthine--ammonia ligase [Segetibacter sp.]|jgi:uncharacterized protein (TIGR00290 family)|nr:diphthine--ammonia ligase [Segetibacter sp.]